MLLGGIAVVIALLVFAAVDVYWPIGAVLVAAGFVSTGVYSFPLWAWILGNPLSIAAYFVIGLPWLFFRWTRFVEKQLKREIERKAANKDTPYAKLTEIPTWKEHKWKFAPYYCYWPIDVIVYLLNDVIREIWNLVSRMVSETFDRYARWRFRKLTGGN